MSKIVIIKEREPYESGDHDAYLDLDEVSYVSRCHVYLKSGKEVYVKPSELKEKIIPYFKEKIKRQEKDII